MKGKPTKRTHPFWACPYLETILYASLEIRRHLSVCLGSPRGATSNIPLFHLGEAPGFVRSQQNLGRPPPPPPTPMSPPIKRQPATIIAFRSAERLLARLHRGQERLCRSAAPRQPLQWNLTFGGSWKINMSLAKGVRLHVDWWKGVWGFPYFPFCDKPS